MQEIANGEILKLAFDDRCQPFSIPVGEPIFVANRIAENPALRPLTEPAARRTPS